MQAEGKVDKAKGEAHNVAGDMQGDMQLALGDADIAFSGDQLVVQSSPVLIE